MRTDGGEERLDERSEGDFEHLRSGSSSACLKEERHRKKWSVESSYDFNDIIALFKSRIPYWVSISSVIPGMLFELMIVGLLENLLTLSNL